MQIVCPNCATAYEITAAALGAGRSVRCARCKQVWFAEAVAEPAMAGAAAAAAPPPPPPPPPPAPPPDAESEGLDQAAIDAAFADISSDADTGNAATAPAIADAPGLVPQDEEDEDDANPDIVTDPKKYYRLKQARLAKSKEDLEEFAAKRAKRNAKRSLRWPLGPSATILLGLCVVMAGLIGWRNNIVRTLPQTASFYRLLGLGVNLRGLDFRDITTLREQHDGVNVVVIEGTIVSVVPKPVEVPRLRFAVRNEAGVEIYTWTALPAKSILQPGEALAFRTRLASPPPEMRAVVVRFFNRRDAVAGTH